MPLSARQMEYLSLAWQCFETEPKIDYEKFKNVAGLTSVPSARELMRVTKNKLRDEYGALSGSVQNANSGNATPKTPKTSSPRKRAAPGTGSCKGRKSTAKKNATPAVSGGEGSDDDEEATPAARKKARADSASPTKSANKAKVEPKVDADEEVFFQ